MHDALFLCENVDSAYAELRDKPCQVRAPETDPDGFQLCFQHPVAPEA